MIILTNFYIHIKKYALTLSITCGLLWLLGSILGIYFSDSDNSLYISALIIGGMPIISGIIGFKFHILGSILLFINAFFVILAIYFQINNIYIIYAVFIAYSLPLILSAVKYLEYWYRSKTRI